VAEQAPGPRCGLKDQVNWKNEISSSGLEPATFWLSVYQYLILMLISIFNILIYAHINVDIKY
jgi:hypothetical protein